jgi:hypothetical protein
MLQCCLHVQGVPEHNGIGHQAKRIQLIFLPFTIRFTDFPSLPVADGAGNLVPALTPVQLSEDATPVDLVIDIVEQVDGLIDTTQINDRLGQSGGAFAFEQGANQFGSVYCAEF